MTQAELTKRGYLKAGLTVLTVEVISYRGEPMKPMLTLQNIWLWLLPLNSRVLGDWNVGENLDGSDGDLGEG